MKIALIGYGKMGKMIEQIALDRGHEIVSIIDIDNQQDFDSPEFASADVAIEFTAPQAAYGNYLKAWAKGVKVVSGSTGWMTEHGDEVRKACNEEGKTPSGTAITLAEEIVDNIDRKEAWKEDTTDKKYLRVDHIRRGEVPGIHTIRYDSDADLITITHDAHSRKGFALGAVLAAEYTSQHQGLLTISDMFKF